MRQTIRNTLTTAADMLAKPVLLFYALPWLMCLLVMGTVAQRYSGLYQSERIFFGSFIFWLGYIPLPGAYATLGLIALSLIANLALKSTFSRGQAGVLLTHISALVLLAGGLISACAREEGYIVLGQGDVGHTISDYYQRELAVIKNGTLLEAIPEKELRNGNVIARGDIPFSIHIENYCYACNVVPRTASNLDLRGMAQKVDIAAVSLAKEDAENHSGAVFIVNGASPVLDGTYVTFQNLAEQPGFTLGKDTYRIEIRPLERPLPFDIRLLHFTKSDYPGTEMARAYRSDVAVKDASFEWNTAIEMNTPLRYHGYTIYQSSFVERDGKLLTVLAVVKNVGQWFPYIAIAMLCAGLLLHFAMTFMRRYAS